MSLLSNQRFLAVYSGVQVAGVEPLGRVLRK